MPLITARWRVPALVAVGAAVAVVAALGTLTYRSANTPFDNWVVVRLIRHVGPTGARIMIDLSAPALSIGILAAVAVGAVIARRWDLLALTVIGPALAVLVSEEVLKPVVGRLAGPFVYVGSTVAAEPGAFPSGHETGVVAAALVLLLVAGQLRMRTAWRALLWVLLAAWTVVAALGLVRNFYHYATDTIGGLGVSVAVVLATALVIDRVRKPVSSPDVRSLASTSRGA